jgi:hypothetical protein
MSIVTKANDSLVVKGPLPIRDLELRSENNYYRIYRKDILVPFPEREVSLFSWILLDEMPTTSYNPIYPWELKFVKCSFSVYETPFVKIGGTTISKYLLFDSCLLNYLTLVNLKENLTVINSTIRSLVIDSASNCELRFNSNMLLGILRVMNSRNVKLNLQNQYHDSSSTVVYKCATNDILIVPNYASESHYLFIDDTLSGYVSTPIVSVEKISKSDKEQRFQFINCYIDADFWNFGNYYNSVISFENCTFGPKAYLGNLGVHKLTFRNCRNTPSQLPLSFSNDSTKILLSLINTEVSNIKIEFPENVDLVFDSTDKNDVAYNTFESLLEKYRLEGKHDSYRNVDIQYRRFAQNRIINWVDKIWWYHGYRKYYVFYWLMITLAIFSTINYAKWNLLEIAYPIVDDEKDTYYNSVHYKTRNIARRIVKVTVFTSLVFFSLNMNFTKLSFKKVSVASWIFFQYIVGLAFLFLILNYVVKG